jgi:predicted AAA+ superfamily ATPase
MDFEPRAIAAAVRRDLDRKIVLISGPRQSGKTTLARSLFRSHDYLNFDSAQDRLALTRGEWDRKADLVVLDELHKKARWKTWLKGVFDTEGVRPRLLVTGSARMDLGRRAGDSLAGRFFHHRLHPFDLKEVHRAGRESEQFATLMACGGFPEPFLAGSEQEARRWRRGHLDVVLRQDLLDLEQVRDITAIETLVQMMRERAGKSVSYSNLSRDLERDPKTVKHWLEILESLYVLFKVTPYSTKIARSLLKEPRYFFFDNGQVESAEGERFENLVACALLKELHRIEDQEGWRTALHYLRTRNGREADFLAVVDGKPALLLEAKWRDDQPSSEFRFFAGLFPQAERVWLVAQPVRKRSLPDGTLVRNAPEYLARLEIPRGVRPPGR